MGVREVVVVVVGEWKGSKLKQTLTRKERQKKKREGLMFEKSANADLEVAEGGLNSRK